MNVKSIRYVYILTRACYSKKAPENLVCHSERRLHVSLRSSKCTNVDIPTNRVDLDSPREAVRYMMWATVYYRDVLKGPTDDTQTKFSCD